MIQISPAAAFWTRLQTLPLPSGPRLLEWLGEDDRRYYYRAGPAASGDRHTVLSAIAGDDAAIQAQLASWTSAAQLSHPNLIHVFEAGRLALEDQQLAYALIEFPDEDLATIIQERPLDPSETRKVAAALLSALEYLHGKNLVHGDIGPRSIVAVGDTIKLLIHDIHPAQPGDQTRDVQALGITLFQLLTANNAPGPQDLTAIPQPFRSIIEGAVQGAWDLPRISRELDPNPEPSVSPSTQASAQSAPHRFPKWGFVIAIAAFLGLWLLWIPSNRAAPPQPSPQQNQPAAAARLPAANPPAANPAVWRVIAYTYANRKDAEARVAAVRRKWPRSEPEVFAPRHPEPPYLVSIGGRMTRAEAQRLQRQARSLGLPQDTFLRNYPN